MIKQIGIKDIELKILDKEIYGSGTVPKHSILPSYSTEGSNAMDLRTTKDLIMLPGCTQLVPTGIAIHINNPNIGALIIPRSGIGHKEGTVLGNLSGLIDSDYTGPLMVSLWNRADVVRYYNKGDRIAQILFIPTFRVQWNVVEEFSESTQRGSNGFNSSGVE